MRTTEKRQFGKVSSTIHLQFDSDIFVETKQKKINLLNLLAFITYLPMPKSICCELIMSGEKIRSAQIHFTNYIKRGIKIKPENLVSLRRPP